MHGQESPVDDAGQWEQVEAIHEHVVYLLVVLVQTLRFEVKEICHLSALVIASDERDSSGIAYFEAVKKN